MSEKEDQQNNKNNSIDLRVILLGDVGVGKKSIINRFKNINSSNTETIDFNGFYSIQKKTQTYTDNKKKLNKSQESPTNQKSKKDITTKSVETVDQETEEDKAYKWREEKELIV